MTSAIADDAPVLPKGRSTVVVENLFYFPTNERFGPDGKAESLTEGFDGRRLDSSVFTLLQPLDPFAGGSASIGDASLRFKYHYNILNFGAAYRVTDRLTIGIEIPHYWVRNDVKAPLNSAPGSTANVGLSTGPGPGPLWALRSPSIPWPVPTRGGSQPKTFSSFSAPAFEASLASASSGCATSRMTASGISCWARNR